MEKKECKLKCKCGKMLIEGDFWAYGRITMTCAECKEDNLFIFTDLGGYDNFVFRSERNKSDKNKD